MDDDIYDKLMKQGLLKREIDHNKNKLLKKDKLNKQKILNKVLYRNYDLDDNEKFVPDILSKKDEKNIIIENMIDKKSNIEYINYLISKYEIELKDYKYIDSQNINEIKLGGYVRSIDLEENLKWGGTVIKLVDIGNLSKFKIKLMNSKKNTWNIKYSKFYIFFKKTVSSRDTFRNLFIKKANLNF